MQYLKTENVHLIKDMGMIPYKLYKLHNYDSTVVTYKNGDYSYLEHEVKGLKLELVKRIFHSYTLDGALYLARNAERIDILQIFHCTFSSVIYTLVYKFFNKKGKIYLKLDCSHKLVERINGLSKWKFNLLNMFFDRISLISVEQKELYCKLKKLLPGQRNKIVNVTNGIDFKQLSNLGMKYDYSVKENVVLNVARIGAEEKNTKMLLEAFARIPGIEKGNWTLKLVGKIENGFDKEIEKYFHRYPKLRNKVLFTGPMEDRKRLYEEYGKSKIFSLTSDFESFGIAFIEAAALGNIIVSTDVGIAKELVEENNGKLVPTGEVDALAAALEEFMSVDSLKHLCDASAKICRKNFDWDEIIHKLHIELTKVRDSEY